MNLRSYTVDGATAPYSDVYVDDKSPVVQPLLCMIRF